MLPKEGLQRLVDLKERLAAAEAEVDRLRPQVTEEAKTWTIEDSAFKSQEAAPKSKLHVRLAGDAVAISENGETLQPSEMSGKITWTESLLGQVAKFTGLHTLAYGQAIAPEREKPFAISFWVKPDKIGSILDKIDLKQGSRGFDIYWQQDGRLELHFIHSWPGDAMKVSTKAKESVPRNQWSHVMVNYDGTGKAAGVTVHVNGKPVPLKVEHDKLRSSFTVDEPIRIGRTSRGWMFFGYLSDVRYFEKNLSENEITAIARSGLQGIFREKAAGVTAEIKDAKFQTERAALFADFSDHPIAVELRKAEASVIGLQKEITDLEASAPTVMVMEELSKPRQTFVLIRGEYDKPDKSQAVTADTPAFLGKLPDDVKKDRLALANWMTAEENPLTARVRVNRLWQMLFGVGLVKTSENFGVQAEPASHPELLDWLAVEYIRLGWDT
ncbi:MAG: DUF1553 domain-containing protein, partial [Lacipirellulaceae bacterium]